jgi:ribosomal-protein-alanine N-acetyltransferase
MTEAVNGALAFAFGTWNLHRVAAGYMPRNSRSAAVLRRCGFQIEGHASAYLMINGRWEDHVLTAIINKDLPAI